MNDYDNSVWFDFNLTVGNEFFDKSDLPLLVVPLLKLVFPLLALSLQELEVDNSGNYVV